MLRLPLRRIYRAFPELDRFKDDQCAQYVSRALRDLGCFYYILPPLAVAILFCACLVLLVAFFRHGGTAILGLSQSVVLTVSIIVGVPLIGGFLARDYLLHFMLRRHVRSKVERSRCPTCKYSLLGQRVVNDLVRCPECGQSTTLQALGLGSAEELIPPIDATDAPAKAVGS